MKNLKLFILFLCSIFSMGLIASSNNVGEAQLGRGMSPFSKRFLGNPFDKSYFTKPDLSGYTTSLSMNSQTDSKKISEDMSMNSKLSASYGPFGGNVSMGMSEHIEQKGYSTSFFSMYTGKGVSSEIVTDQHAIKEQLTPEAKNCAEKDPEKFIRQYGTYYVKSVKLGVSFNSKFTITYDSYEAGAKIKSKLGAGVSVFDVSGELQKSFNDLNSKGTVKFEATQYGQHADELGRLGKLIAEKFSGNVDIKTSEDGLTTYEMSDLRFYQEFADAVNAAQGEYISGLNEKDDLGIIGFTYEPYPDDIFGELPKYDKKTFDSLVNLINFYKEITTEREFLKTAYNLSIDKTYGGELSIMPCSHLIRKALRSESLSSKLVNDVKDFIKAKAFHAKSSEELNDALATFKSVYKDLNIIYSNKEYKYHNLVKLVKSVHNTGFYLNAKTSEEFTYPTEIINGGFETETGYSTGFKDGYYKDQEKYPLSSYNSIFGSDPKVVNLHWSNSEIGPVNVGGVLSKNESLIMPNWVLVSSLPYVHNFQGEKVEADHELANPEGTILFKVYGISLYYLRIRSLFDEKGAFKVSTIANSNINKKHKQMMI